ncbi:hypothetical protein BDD12DRAFT_886544 [Trichophaea hybrida]|nr:hypothetical protein BDD12DRAFT_886544 [Trichophaea hybrida]
MQSVSIQSRLQICERFLYNGFALLTIVALVPGFDAVDAWKGKLDCVYRFFKAVGRDGGGALVAVEDERAIGGATLVFGGAGSVFDTLDGGGTLLDEKQSQCLRIVGGQDRRFYIGYDVNRQQHAHRREKKSSKHK